MMDVFGRPYYSVTKVDNQLISNYLQKVLQLHKINIAPFKAISMKFSCLEKLGLDSIKEQNIGIIMCSYIVHRPSSSAGERYVPPMQIANNFFAKTLIICNRSNAVFPNRAKLKKSRPRSSIDIYILSVQLQFCTVK